MRAVASAFYFVPGVPYSKGSRSERPAPGTVRSGDVARQRGALKQWFMSRLQTKYHRFLICTVYYCMCIYIYVFFLREYGWRDGGMDGGSQGLMDGQTTHHFALSASSMALQTHSMSLHVGWQLSCHIASKDPFCCLEDLAQLR